MVTGHNVHYLVSLSLIVTIAVIIKMNTAGLHMIIRPTPNVVTLNWNFTIDRDDEMTLVI